MNREMLLIKTPGRVIIYVDRVKVLDTTNDDPYLKSFLEGRSYHMIAVVDNPHADHILASFWSGEKFQFPLDLSLDFWNTLLS